MKNHPDSELLERFLRGKLKPAERRRVVRHLLAGCERCRTLAGQLWAGAAERPLAPESPEGIESPVYQGALDRAIELARERRGELAAWRREAPGLLAELLDLEPASRLDRARGEPRYASLPLCELILARRAASASSSESSRPLAELALAVVERLDPNRWGISIVHDAQARASAHFADALRAAGDLEGATEAFQRARALSALGTQDAGEWAEIVRFEARLEVARRRFDGAFTLASEAAAIYRKLGERELLAETLAEIGPFAARSGRLETAIEALSEAVRMFGPGRDAGRLACALMWLGALLAEAGRGREALAPLWRARSLYERLGDPIEILRIRWLEARATVAAGSLEQGEAALLAVRPQLLEAGLGREAAGALLDLAQIYLPQGRGREMRELTGELFFPFRSRDLHTGTVAAMLFLRRAVETGNATLDLVRELATYVAASRPSCQPA